MENQTQLKQAFFNFRAELHKSLAPYYLVLLGIGVATIVIVANTDLIYSSESIAFYLPFIPMAVGMWYAHKRMMKDPLLRSIAGYVDAVKQSTLTGDELVKLGLLPKDKDLNKISKYSMGLQRDIYLNVFQGLKDTTFSSTEAVPLEFQQTVKLIGIAAGNGKRT